MTTQIEPPRLYPSYRYRDPVRAIEWFVDTLGFTERARYHDGPRIAHTELGFGSSIIMIGEVGAWRWTTSTGSSRGVEGSGVRIDEKPTERPYGSREFTCRDPEGNVWCFGTYWPKATDPV
jgi:uncharacterized glyoxalase superfamily protein PhnB